jgi:hypothetical protein
MNSNFRSQFNYSMAGKAETIRAEVAIGAAGAPTLVAGTGAGVLSIARTAAGAYTVVLRSPSFALTGVRATMQSGASAPTAPLLNVVSDTINSSAVPALQIQFRSLAGAATDPASGEIIHLTIELNGSNTGY